MALYPISDMDRGRTWYLLASPCKRVCENGPLFYPARK